MCQSILFSFVDIPTTGRLGHGCAIIEIPKVGRGVVAAGGYSHVYGHLKSVERLVMKVGEDSAKWEWETLEDLPKARFSTTLTPTLDKKGVWMIGGCDESCKDQEYPSDVYEFSPTDKMVKWKRLEGVRFTGEGHTVATILAC